MREVALHVMNEVQNSGMRNLEDESGEDRKRGRDSHSALFAKCTAPKMKYQTLCSVSPGLGTAHAPRFKWTLPSFQAASVLVFFFRILLWQVSKPESKFLG